MTELRFTPATPALWVDVEHALTGGGDAASCWCQWFRQSAGEWRSSSSEQRRADLRDEIAAVALAPGLIAYADDVAAGWCRVGPRAAHPRLIRSTPASALHRPTSCSWEQPASFSTQDLE